MITLADFINAILELKLHCYVAGLPDGIFPNQKSQFGYIFRDLQWKKLIYFWPFGLFYEHLV
jgi:hypothetical protein